MTEKVAEKPKKLTLRQKLEIALAQKASVEDTLKLTTEALNESIEREKQMCVNFAGRVARNLSEHPVEFSKRVVTRIDELYKNNSELSATISKNNQEFARKEAGFRSEIQLLNGQLNALEGVLVGAVKMAQAGKPPETKSPSLAPIINEKVDRILRAVTPPDTGRYPSFGPFGRPY